MFGEAAMFSAQVSIFSLKDEPETGRPRDRE
jgi:hypothetical protein